MVITSCLAATLLSGITQGIEAKVQSVLPTAEESRWLSIPWRLNLVEARKESYESQKPLFIWMMNGHPMGCT